MDTFFFFEEQKKKNLVLLRTSKNVEWLDHSYITGGNATHYSHSTV